MDLTVAQSASSLKPGAAPRVSLKSEKGVPQLAKNLNQVNDVGYIDADSIVITARERLGRAEGSMAIFSAATGVLQHRFRVEHGQQPKSFTAGALSLAGPDDNRIFSSCKGRLNEYGIGMWDLNTGQQGDFFYELPGCSLGDADILQWLPSKNCLMIATLFPSIDNCFIGLLAFRAHAGIVVTLEDKRVLHAIAMEDGHSICIIDQYEDLGFIDLRAGTGTNSAGTGVRWSSRSKLMNRKVPFEESWYPKLATHNGQLFSCMNDSISVFNGSEHVLTSTLSRSYGGSICDFSIGGDRLLFDVWEWSPSPII